MTRRRTDVIHIIVKMPHDLNTRALDYLISNLLINHTARYPRMRAFMISLLDLYDANWQYRTWIQEDGIYHVFKFRFLSPTLVLEPEYLEEVKMHLSDIFENRNYIDKTVYEKTKQEIVHKIEGIFEDPYETIRYHAMVHQNNRKEEQIPAFGTLKDYDMITYEMVQDHLKSFFKKAKITYQTSSHDENLIAYLNTLFNETQERQRYLPKTLLTSALTVTFSIPQFHQASLVIYYEGFKRADDPMFWNMYVLNTLLSEGGNALLFTEIREKKGYSYSIHASIYDHYLVIQALVDLKRYQEARFDILELMGNLKSLITKERLDLAKKSMLDKEKMHMDDTEYPDKKRLLEWVTGLDIPSLETFAKGLESVTIESIHHVIDNLQLVKILEMLGDEDHD